MLLTDLVEDITSHLENSEANWNGSSRTLIVRSELDVLRCLDSGLGVYVLPGFIDYSIDQSAKRQTIKQLVSIAFVSVVISTSFQEISDADGITTWEEAKEVVDIRQRVDEELIMNFSDPAISLVSVESQPPEEITLEARNFLVQTVLGYQQTQCDTRHELLSSSTASIAGLRTGRTVDSIRSRVLSAKRQGRR